MTVAGEVPRDAEARRFVASALAVGAVASAAAWSASWGAVAVAVTVAASTGLLAWWLPTARGPGAERVAAGALSALALPWFTVSPLVAAVHLLVGVVAVAASMRARSARPARPARPADSTPKAAMTAKREPLTPARPAPPLRLPSPDPTPPPRRTSVLLVDDNPANRFYGTLLLKRLGHDVEAASTGEQAVDAAQARRFDVVLMDVRMPGMGGVAATQVLRRRIPPHKRPFIVALTADDRPEERERLLRAGMDAFLAKPLQADQLTELLHAVAEPAGRGGSGGGRGGSPSLVASA